MTQLKIDSKVATKAEDALTLHIAGLYANLTKHIVVIAELAPTERNQLAPDSAKKNWVKLQVKHIEVAGEKQEEAVRAAMDALHTTRTAFGTITEDLDITLSEATLDRCAGELSLLEAARLHAVVERFGERIGELSRAAKTSAPDLRRELATVSRALLGTIYPNMLPTSSE